jgi:hypothetical protein
MSSWTSGSSFVHPKDDVAPDSSYAAYGSIPTKEHGLNCDDEHEHEHEHEHDAAVQHVENKRKATSTARSKTRSWSFHDDAAGAPLQRHPSLMRHPGDTASARTHKVDTTSSSSSSSNPNKQPSSSKKKGGTCILSCACFIILFLSADWIYDILS